MSPTVAARSALLGALGFLVPFALLGAVLARALLGLRGGGADASLLAWLLVPVELLGLLCALLGGFLAARVLTAGGPGGSRLAPRSDGGPGRRRPGLLPWSAGGPILAAFGLLAAGGFQGGVVRAGLDLAVVAGGAAIGARLA
jgi:hypothetical protein